MAPLGLGPVKRRIGIGKQRLDVAAAVARIECGTDTEPDGNFLPADIEVFGDRFEHTVGQGRRRLRLLASGGENDEFVAADARDKLAVHGPVQPLGDGAKQFVADDVPENVVGLLEVVKIDAEDGKLAAIRVSLFDDALQFDGKRRPVRQAIQRVVMSEKGNLLMPGDQLGAREFGFTGTMLTEACAASRSPRPSAAMACENCRKVPEVKRLAALLTSVAE